eukprot:3810927-Amphidinium_carterae.1
MHSIGASLCACEELANFVKWLTQISERIRSIFDFMPAQGFRWATAASSHPENKLAPVSYTHLRAHETEADL